jgi:hypothetical protein
MVAANNSQPGGAENRLKDLGIQLPAPPTPFGSYVEAVQTGNLLFFFSGMLPLWTISRSILGGWAKNLMPRRDAMPPALRLISRRQQQDEKTEAITVRIPVSNAAHLEELSSSLDVTRQVLLTDMIKDGGRCCVG